MLFMNNRQQAANSLIQIIIFYLDLAVLIGVPIYTFIQYGFGSAIIMVFVSLFIISPIVTYTVSAICAVFMSIWMSISK